MNRFLAVQRFPFSPRPVGPAVTSLTIIILNPSLIDPPPLQLSPPFPTEAVNQFFNAAIRLTLHSQHVSNLPVFFCNKDMKNSLRL